MKLRSWLFSVRLHPNHVLPPTRQSRLFQILPDFCLKLQPTQSQLELNRVAGETMVEVLALEHVLAQVEPATVAKQTVAAATTCKECCALLGKKK